MRLLDVAVNPYVLILIVGLVVLYGRLVTPRSRRPGGVLVQMVPLPLLARLRLHAFPVAIIAGLVLLGLVAGWVPYKVATLAFAALVGLFLVPIRYTLTDEGIVLSRTRFRRWTEFGGLARRRGGAHLQGIAGARGMNVWLAGSHGTDELILLLRQLIRGSYKGQIGPISRAPQFEKSAEVPPARPLEPVQVAGR